MASDHKTQGVQTPAPLTSREQTRNIVLYGVNVALVYLAAPVLYVGITQAALFETLHASKRVANLPQSIYFWATPLPIAVAWLFPAVRHLKPVLVACYLSIAAMGAVVACALYWPTPEWARQPIESLGLPPDWVAPALILHGGVLGCALGIVAALQWEVLGRGVDESRRGQALALAFGAGPILAAIGSVGQQLVLEGSMFGWTVPRLAYPHNFALLFGASVPMMVLAAGLSWAFVVRRPTTEIAREPFFTSVFGGFGAFFSYRLILVASLATILVGAGYSILNNISLFTQEAIGKEAATVVGYQNFLRFGFKAVAGLFLGWMLTKTHPKAGLLFTGAFCLASVLWVFVVPGIWFMAAFCLMGAGELYGVYYPNYILSCSAKSKMRRNMAFTSMLNMPVGLAATFYGYIADNYELRTETTHVSGLRLSFLAAMAVLFVTLMVVQFALPGRPRPRESDKDESDRALEGGALEGVSS